MRETGQQPGNRTKVSTIQLTGVYEIYCKWPKTSKSRQVYSQNFYTNNEMTIQLARVYEIYFQWSKTSKSRQAYNQYIYTNIMKCAFIQRTYPYTKMLAALRVYNPNGL
jgi:hypothetical protein